MLVQRGLGALEYASGPADGAFGPSTRQALEQWQTAKGYAATGYLERDQADILMELGRAVVPVGIFVMETEPAGAEVELLGVEEAYRPGVELPVGRYQVEVQAEGYETARVWVEHTESGEPHRVVLEARRQPFTIVPEPAEARVRILNIAESYTARMALPAGEYEVEVSAEGYETKTERVAHGREPTERRIALARAGRQVGETFRDCPTCPRMVVVPAGSYQMGSPLSEAGRSSYEEPAHQVRIAEPFAVGVYEVTRGEYGQFVAATGYAGGKSCSVLTEGGLFRGGQKDHSGRSWRDPGFGQTNRGPVVCVNWGDAQAYIRWLSGETNKGYRLLSEAEWEYVARAGTQTARYWGEGEVEQCGYANGRDQTYKRYARNLRRDLRDSVAMCADGYPLMTAPVGTYQANRFGLYDVLGNVWEWTQDCWNPNYRGAPPDGRAWESGDCSRHVVRGGSWLNEPRDLRSAIRGYGSPGIRGDDIGFRIARSLP